MTGTVTSYALNELSWVAVGRVLARDPRLLVPVGALEQHGPHLPLGANVRVAEAVVAEVSRRLEILRAPAFSYGVTVGGGSWAGAAGLRRKTFHRAINELLARWEDHGVSEFVIVSAHRFEPHLEALLMALTASSTTTVLDLFHVDVADLLDGDPEEEHGGELETSLLLHLAPELVQTDEMTDFVLPKAPALRRYTRGRVPKPPSRTRGGVGRPSLATPAKGHAVFQRYVDAVCGVLERPPQEPEKPASEPQEPGEPVRERGEPSREPEDAAREPGEPPHESEK
jgi:creatinine amidohydrolase